MIKPAYKFADNVQTLVDLYVSTCVIFNKKYSNYKLYFYLTSIIMTSVYLYPIMPDRTF